jgi:hypothetical protein
MDQKEVERLIKILEAANPDGGLNEADTDLMSRIQGQPYAGEESDSVPMMPGYTDAEPMEEVSVNPATAFVPNAMNDAGGPMGMGAMTEEEQAIADGIIANQQKRRAAKAF